MGHRALVPAVTHRQLQSWDSLSGGSPSQHLPWAQVAPSARFGCGEVSEKCCVISQGQRLSLPSSSPSVFQRDLAEALRCWQGGNKTGGGCSWHWDGTSLPLASLCYQLPSHQPLELSTWGRAQLLDGVVEIPEMSEIHSISSACAGAAETLFPPDLSCWI